MKDIIIRVGAIILVALSLVGGFLVWEKYKKAKLEKWAYKEHEISKLIQAGNYQKAKDLIKEASSEGGPFKSLYLSYNLYLLTETKENIEEGKVLIEILENTKDKDLQALYRERYAYYLFNQGKSQEALKELEKIREEDFNYVSALLLKAQILQKEGKDKEAGEVLKKVINKSPNTYFANIALALLGE